MNSKTTAAVSFAATTKDDYIITNVGAADSENPPPLPDFQDDITDPTLLEDVDSSTSTNQRPLRHVASISGVEDFITQQAAETGVTKVVDPSPLLDGRTNLLSAKEGARVLFATDEWFATADNLLQDTDPVFDPDAYCEQGKVIDGYETRRRREIGHDWCIIKMSERATVSAVVIDTAFFTGNHVPRISIQVADLTDCFEESTMVAAFPGAVTRLLHGGIQGTGATPDEVFQAEKACGAVHWVELLPVTPLQPGYDETRMHYFSVDERTATHVRVNYYPDGGVARLRLYGNPEPAKQVQLPRRPLYSPIVTGRTCSVVRHGNIGEPLFSNHQPYPQLSLGGVGVTCSNQHYGVPSNLLQNSLGRDMGDGWETARHPERPGVLVKNDATGLVDSNLSDWAVLQLGRPARSVQAVILDTRHFRGNYPESVQVEGCFCDEPSNKNGIINNEALFLDGDDIVEWFPLVPRGRMAPDAEHLYEASKCYDNDDGTTQKTPQLLHSDRPVSHVRVSIYPDGGLSRVRVYGVPLFEEEPSN